MPWKFSCPPSRRMDRKPNNATMNVQIPTTGDIGPWINKQLSEDQAVITLPPGRFRSSEPIQPLGTNARDQLIQGAGQRETIIEIGPHMIGIDLRWARQVTIQNLEIKEVKGSRKSICIALGGLSCNVWNVWCGNAKYGIVGAMGSGIDLRSIRVEAMKYHAFLFQSNFTDLKTGLDETTNIRHVLGSSLFAYNCGTGVGILKGFGNLTQKIYLNGVSITDCAESLVNQCMDDDCKIEGLMVTEPTSLS